METAFLVIGAHGVVIGVLHFLEKKDIFEVDWSFLKIGIMAEVGYALWTFMNQLTMFL